MTERVLTHLKKMVEALPDELGADVRVEPREDGGVSLIPKVDGVWRFDRAILLDDEQAWQMRLRMREWMPDLPPGSGCIYMMVLYFAFGVGVFLGYLLSS